MKKWIALTFVLACVLTLAGCKKEQKLFDITGAASIHLCSGLTGDYVDVADVEDIKYVTDNINGLVFEKGKSHKGENGYAYSLRWYDADHGLLTDLYVMDEYTIMFDGYYYNGLEADYGIDIDYLRSLLDKRHEEPSPNASVAETASVRRAYGGLLHELTEDEIEVMRDLVETGTWQKGTYDDFPDWILTIGEKEIHYSCNSGIFQNYAEETNLRLEEEQRLSLNALLITHIPFGWLV